MSNRALRPYCPEISLNVKVFQLAFSIASEFDSTLSPEEVSRLFEQVNTVWECARIRWKLQSIEQRSISARQAGCLFNISTKPELRKLFRDISPFMPQVLRNRIWSLCLMARFPVRSWGVYLPETQTVFLAESSRGFRVNAVTLAHEFGHMLGLQHVGKKENIMNQRFLKELQTRMAASPAWRDHIQPLDEGQILDARAQAQLGPYSSSLGKTNASPAALDALHKYEKSSRQKPGNGRK